MHFFKKECNLQSFKQDQIEIVQHYKHNSYPKVLVKDSKRHNKRPSSNKNVMIDKSQEQQRNHQRPRRHLPWYKHKIIQCQEKSLEKIRLKPDHHASKPMIVPEALLKTSRPSNA